MPSKATTVEQYLAGLPEARREALKAVHAVILKSLDKDYAEGIQYGMIGYFVPHSVYPAGYHCDPKIPLPFASLGSQKSHMSLHLMHLFMDPKAAEKFQAAWAKTGKKLDMGKACIRFKKLEDLSLEVIAETIAKMPARKYIETYVAGISGRATKGASTKKDASTKGAAKKAGSKKAASAKNHPAKARISKIS
ncbi:MAG: DUF1801 domain-containing protein [Polyangiaceae bacterium]|nr:DUF1801 domain-containing protein [Polyangiaceae bacterium]